MAKPILLLLCLVAALTAVSSVSPRNVISNFVTFPYAENPCNCGLLACTCCTGIKVAKIGFSKALCVVVVTYIFSMTFDVTIKLDNKVVSSFSFSPNNPPTICVPIALPISLSMCLKIHDTVVSDNSNMQVCMTLYGAYGGNNTVVLPLNCLMLVSGSLQYVVTTTTTTTTAAPRSRGQGTTTTSAPTTTTTQKPTTTTTTTTTPKPTTTTTTTTTTPKPTTTTTAATTTTSKPATTAAATTTTSKPATTTTTTTEAAKGKGNRRGNRAR